MNQSQQSRLSSAFYLPLGDGRYEPTESTIGPWAAGTQHGGPPGALLMHALSTYPSAQGLEIARLTIEILGPVPVGACEVTVGQVRAGKRIELLRAQYATGGKVFMVAHAWRTERLAETFALGEFMPSVRLLTREDKRRALTFTQKGNQLLAALEVNDLTRAATLVEEIQKIAGDFDASKPLAKIVEDPSSL